MTTLNDLKDALVEGGISPASATEIVTALQAEPTIGGGGTVDAAGVLTAMQAMDTTQQTSARTAISAAQDLPSVTLSAIDFSGGNINLSASAHANRTIFVNSNTAGLTLTLKDDATAGWADDDFVMVKMASGATGSAILIGAGGAGNSTLTTGTGASASTATAVGGTVSAQRTGANAFVTLSSAQASASSATTTNLFLSGFAWAGYQYAGAASASSYGGGGVGNNIDTSALSGAASASDGGAAVYGWRPRGRVTAAVAAASRATGYAGSVAGRRCRFDATNGGNLPIILGGGIADANTEGTFFLGLMASSGASTGIAGVETSAISYDLVGVGADSTDANLSIMHKPNTGTATKIALGASFPKSQWTYYSVLIESVGGGTSINVTVTNGNTGATSTATITTNLPRNTQDYYHVRCRSATASAASFVAAPAIDDGGFIMGKVA